MLLMIALAVIMPLELSAFIYENIEYEQLTETTAGTMSLTTATYKNGHNVLNVSGDVVIPSTVYDTDGTAYTVTQIGAYGFRGNNQITSLTLPETLDLIKNYAFYSCTGLKELVLPEGLSNIGTEAFDKCSGITGELILPESLTSIGTYAFAECSGFTGELKLPQNITSIGSNAFYKCTGFTSLKLPEGLTTIGSNAFYSCTGFTGELILPKSLTSIGRSAFRSCSGFTGELILPEGLTSLDTESFQSCSGFSGVLIIPESMTIIPSCAFQSCSGFTGVKLHDQISTIKDRAFMDCSGLSGELLIPTGISTIGEFAFQNCTSLTSVTIPSNVTSIQNRAFYMNDPSELREIIIESGNQVLTMNNVFNKLTSNSTSLYLGRNISGYTFDGFSNLKNISIGEEITTIPNNMFANCNNITGVTFESATPPTIGTGCFSESAIKNVIATVPNESLNSYRENDKYMFVSYDLTDPLVKTVDGVEYKVIFGKTESDVRIVVTGGKPDGNGNLTIAPEVTIDGKTYLVTSIAPDAFKENTNIVSVTVPSTIKEIGESAFADCDNLKTVTIEGDENSESIKIAEKAFDNSPIETLNQNRDTDGTPFDNKTSLKNVTIGENVKSLTEGEFEGCDNIENIGLQGTTPPAGLDNAFSKETKENAKVTVPTENFKEYRNELGGDFDNLEPEKPLVKTENGIEYEIVFGKTEEEDTVKVTGGNPDTDGNLTIEPEIEIDGKKYPVTTIDPDAFKDNSEIKSVTVPSTVKEIGEGAFEGCDNIDNIEFQGTTPPAGIDNAFSKETKENAKVTVPTENFKEYRNELGGDFDNLEPEKPLVKTENGIEYEIVFGKTEEEDTVKVTGGNPDTDGNLTIEEEIEIDGKKYPVTTIEPDAFKDNTEIKSVTVPSSLKEIGEGAFEGCDNIDTIEFQGTTPPAGIDNAFSKETKDNAKVTVPDESKEAYEEAIGDEFQDIEPACGVTETIDGIVYKVNKESDENEVTVVGSTDELSGNVTIPETVTIDGVEYTVTKIEKGAFSGNTDITGVTIPDTVTEIGEGAFGNCGNLKTVIVGSGVTSLEGVFTGSENIEKVIAPETVIEGAELPDGTVTITYPEGGEPELSGDLLISEGENGNELVSVPSDTREIVIPDNVTKIGNGAFIGCTELETITIPNHVESIGESAFRGCESLKEVEIGTNVATIGREAFKGCSALTEIALHSGITEVGEEAFANSGLTKVYLGAGIVKIGENAFAGDHIEMIAITAQAVPETVENAFGNFDAKLYVQTEANKADYGRHSVWGRFEAETMVVATAIESEQDSNLLMETGESRQLNVTVVPENVTIPHIFWESTNPDVATVDNHGVVTFHRGARHIGSTTRAEAENDDCKIIARTLFAGGPVMEYTFNGVTTGIDGIEIESDAGALRELIMEDGVKVYTLDGNRVRAAEREVESGYYIVVKNGKSSKLFVK